MKLKTQEIIRAIELSSFLGVTIASIILTANSDTEQFREISRFLEENRINLYEIQNTLSRLYSLDCLSSYRTQTLTTEYKELKCLYEEIIKNAGEFYKELGTTDPIAIFATYVYMYRSGYFSYNKQFLYSDNMKDFAKLNGIDVIRGEGVCRSISSMLTDIYKKMGMSSYNLHVCTSGKTINHINELNPVELHDDDEDSKFLKLVTILSDYLPITNHLITMVEQNGKNYIFDPTNDGFLHYARKKRLVLASNPIYPMKNHSFKFKITLMNILGLYSDGISSRNRKKQIKLPSVSYEEYKMRYLEVLRMCSKNKDLFEMFYRENQTLIDDIHKISKEQSGLAKRLIPIIPK